MELIALPGRPGDWDARIASFDTKTLFHESAWLDFVLRRHPRCFINYYRIVDGSRLIGFFCAIVRRRAALLLCESPDLGRGLHVGPLVNRDVDSNELLAAILRACRRDRIASLTIAFGALETPTTMDAGGFTASNNVQQLCSLEGGSDGAWSRLNKTRRTSLRKAQKDGLTAELTHDPAIVQQFYGHYVQALARKGVTPTDRPEHIATMLRTFVPRDRLFAVRVKHGDRVVGAGFYLHDEETMYFWDGAADADALASYPNDLMHWTAIVTAAQRGIRTFQMSSGPAPQPTNRFAINFGCEQQEFRTYRKELVPLLAPARQAHRWFSSVRAQYPLSRLRLLPIPVTTLCVALGEALG